MNLHVVAKNEMDRSELEQFVHDAFADQYGADIQSYLPWLLGIHDQYGELQGALGMRSAHGTPLFLEQYLSDSIENVVSGATGIEVDRREIIEVGNLAATSPGGARLLILTLTAFLRGAGYQWVTFTALPSLINSFRRLGLPLYHLADARPEYLADNDTDWGNYYRGNPHVVAGNVAEGFRVLDKASAIEQLKAALVWNQAYASGYMHRITSQQLTLNHQY